MRDKIWTIDLVLHPALQALAVVTINFSFSSYGVFVSAVTVMSPILNSATFFSSPDPWVLTRTGGFGGLPF